MQLFLGAVPIILRLFSKARGHLLFSDYSPKLEDTYYSQIIPKPITEAGMSHTIYIVKLLSLMLLTMFLFIVISELF